MITKISDSQSIKKYLRQIEKYFYMPIKFEVDTSKFSILRITPPVVRPIQNEIIIYTGISDSPSPICKLSLYDLEYVIKDY